MTILFLNLQIPPRIRVCNRSDYDGIVFPVNPKHKSVQGIQAFASVDDVPYTPDLAIIAIPAKGV
ncbi:MAG: hypothetical protein GF398_13110, partial [Chitinivibrionales bacterium]|nr:hypothetical protein [Chitinivibrionales bacterium]